MSLEIERRSCYHDETLTKPTWRMRMESAAYAIGACSIIGYVITEFLIAMSN